MTINLMYKKSKLFFIVSLFTLFFSLYNFSFAKTRVLIQKDIISQEMISKTDARYIVRSKVNLNGKRIVIPERSVIVFRGGEMYNGEIEFKDTKIVRPRFYNIIFSGTIKSKRIKDSDYGINGNGSLLIWLIQMAAYNNTNLYLSRNYLIDSKELKQVIKLDNSTIPYDVLIKNSKGFTIEGNGNTITDSYIPQNGSIDFLVLYRCNNVSIRNLKYVQPDNTMGVQFVHTIGDCKNISLTNIIGVNIATVLRSGIWGENNYVTRGLYNSRISVEAYNVRYGVALERADNIYLNMSFKNVHRGVSACGVTNSTIVSKGEQASTPTLVLLKDCISYSSSDCKFEHPIYTECKNLIISSTRTGKLPHYDVAVEISDYGKEYHFSKRTKPYYFENIHLQVYNQEDVKSQGIVLALKGENGVMDRLDLVVDNCSFYNSGYYFLQMSNKDFVTYNVSINNVNTNGRFIAKCNLHSKVIIKNSSLGSMEYSGESENSILLKNTLFNRLVPQVKPNNESIISIN